MTPTRHRGPHPEDAELFHEAQWPALRAATTDLSYLLGRHYATDSALKIVGDRYQLRSRQRVAIRRGAASPRSRVERQSRRTSTLPQNGLALDTFNQLITLETALGGGVLLRGQDGVLRDLAGVHGTWRRGEQSLGALERMGQWLRSQGVRETLWFVDRSVSNSGRLREFILEMGRAQALDVDVAVVGDVDARLITHAGTVVTSDSHILEHCRAWADLMTPWIEGERMWIVDLEEDTPSWPGGARDQPPGLV